MLSAIPLSTFTFHFSSYRNSHPTVTMKHSTLPLLALFGTTALLPLLPARAADDFAQKAKDTIIKDQVQFEEVAPKEVVDFIKKETGIPVLYTPAKDAADEPHISLFALPEPVTGADLLQDLALAGNFKLTYDKDGAHLAKNTGKENTDPAPGADWTRVVGTQPFTTQQGSGLAVFIRYSLAQDGQGIFAVPYYKGVEVQMPVIGSAQLKAGLGGCVRGFLSPGGRPTAVDEIRAVIGTDGKKFSKFAVTFDGTDQTQIESDLSVFKTPASLYVYIVKLRMRPIATLGALTENQKNIQLATDDFLKRFPDSPLKWDILLGNAETAIQLNAMGVSGYDLDKAEADLNKITAAANASDDTKDTAAFDITQIEVNKAPDDGVEPLIAAFHRDHKTAWDDDTVTNLLKSRIRKLKDNDDEQVALLTPLIKSDDKEIVEQAGNLMRMANAKKRLAELQTQPLDLKFTAIDGSEVDISKLRGKVVLVDYWATWCKPCMMEVPNVVAAYNKYHSKGFEIIGISLDRKGDKDKVVSVTKAKGMAWPQYYDGKFWFNQISSTYGIESIPAMWLVNKKGMVVNFESGEALDESIEKLLAE